MYLTDGQSFDILVLASSFLSIVVVLIVRAASFHVIAQANPEGEYKNLDSRSPIPSTAFGLFLLTQKVLRDTSITIFKSIRRITPKPLCSSLPSRAVS